MFQAYSRSTKNETMVLVGYHPTIAYRIFDLVNKRRLLRKDDGK